MVADVMLAGWVIKTSGTQISSGQSLHVAGATSHTSRRAQGIPQCEYVALYYDAGMHRANHQRIGLTESRLFQMPNSNIANAL